MKTEKEVYDEENKFSIALLSAIKEHIIKRNSAMVADSAVAPTWNDIASVRKVNDGLVKIIGEQRFFLDRMCTKDQLKLAVFIGQQFVWVLGAAFPDDSTPKEVMDSAKKYVDGGAMNEREITLASYAADDFRQYVRVDFEEASETASEDVETLSVALEVAEMVAYAVSACAEDENWGERRKECAYNQAGFACDTANIAIQGIEQCLKLSRLSGWRRIREDISKYALELLTKKAASPEA